MLYPDITGDDAYPTLVVRLLPSGLVGLMVAALMAALMSSLAATFNSSSTLITFDVYKKFKPERDRRSSWCASAGYATVVMVALGILWVPFITYAEQPGLRLPAKRPGLHEPADHRGVPRRHPLAARQSPRRHRRADRRRGDRRRALHPRSAEVARRSSPGRPALSYFVAINFLHIAVIIFVISVVVLVVVSLATAAESMAKLRGLTFCTLEGGYALGSSAARCARRPCCRVALAAFVIGLWVWFA